MATYPKGIENGPKPRTERGRKRRAKNQAKGVRYRPPGEKPESKAA